MGWIRPADQLPNGVMALEIEQAGLDVIPPIDPALNALEAAGPGALDERMLAGAPDFAVFIELGRLLTAWTPQSFQFRLGSTPPRCQRSSP